MKFRNTVLSLILLLVITACGSKATPEAMMQDDTPTADAMMMHETPTADAMMMQETPTADAMMMHETPTADAMMMHETPTADAMAQPTDAMMAIMPTWFDTSFKDVRSGNAFTINDFKGKVVLVETMAVWCTTCFQQQQQIKALHETLGMRADFVSVSLDIDPNEDESALTGYTQKNSNFDWYYAIAGADVSRAIGKDFGDQFLNPPSAPIFVIDRHGAAHPLPFGLKSADDLMKAVQPYLDDHM